MLLSFLLDVFLNPFDMSLYKTEDADFRTDLHLAATGYLCVLQRRPSYLHLEVSGWNTDY